MAATKEDDELIQNILSRFNSLKDTREKFVSSWRTAQRYTAPRVENWSDLTQIPTIPTRSTSAPCDYLDTLVSGLSGYSVSQSITWFKLLLENDKQMNMYGVKDWLEECEQIMVAQFNRSNLYSEAIPLIQNAAVCGHGVMFVGENLNKSTLQFSTFRNPEIYLDTGYDNNVNTVYRKYVCKIADAVEMFGLDAMDDNVQTKYKEVRTKYENIEILMAVYPRDFYNEQNADSKNMPYAAVYIDLTNNHLIEESGFKDFPFAVFEWEKMSGYAYSDSPAQKALPDSQALNFMVESEVKLAQLSAQPPMAATRDVRDINMVPNGIIYMPKKDSVLAPINTGANYPITLQTVQDQKETVKSWFHVNFFLMLESNKQQMTATEVLERQGEKAAVLAKLIVNLNGTLQKIIERSFNLLFTEGKLPTPPETLLGKGAGIKIDFCGPLAQAQRKYYSQQGLQSAINVAVPIMQMNSTAADYIDFDMLMKKALEGQGMPQAVIREDDDVKAIREQRAQARAQAIQQQQQQAMTQSIMQNANKLNEPVQQGSPLSEMDSQTSGGNPYAAMGGQ